MEKCNGNHTIQSSCKNVNQLTHKTSVSVGDDILLGHGEIYVEVCNFLQIKITPRALVLVFYILKKVHREILGSLASNMWLQLHQYQTTRLSETVHQIQHNEPV
jgi:hypothetical protein